MTRSEQLSLQEQNLLLQQKINELQAKKSRYEILFEMSADALSIIDLDTGKFVECNQAAIAMHGVKSESNFLDLSPDELSPKLQPCGGSSYDLAKERIRKTVSDGPQIFKWTHSKLDGSTFPCLVSLTALPQDDKNYILAIGRDISALENMQEELETHKEDSKNLKKLLDKNAELLELEKRKFEEFVSLAPVGIAINRFSDGGFDYINEEFSRFSGYSVEELNQMDYWELTPKKYEKQEQDQLDDLSNIGKYGPYQKEYIHKNGDTYPVLLSGIKITDSDGEDYIWSVVQDTSKQKQIEKQLHDAKEEALLNVLRLDIANNSAGIGVWEWDLKSGELHWDDWMYKLYGIAKEQFSGAYEAWESSVHKEDIEFAKNKLEGAIAGTHTYDPEFRVVWPDGNIRTMKASAEVIRDSSGEALKVIGVNYDITDKIETIAELDRAKQLAENSARAKEVFLSNMSHEIRTPMNGIYGTLQLLNQHSHDAENQELIDSAIFSTKNLLTIINDILDFSKIEAGKLELEITEFNLRTLIDSVVSDFQPMAFEKGNTITSVFSESMSEIWWGDPVRIKQILVNLTSNAIKFTEDGEVRLMISIEPETEGRSEVLKVTVSDTGIGMFEKELLKLFERFEQADKSTTRKYGGTGLGMSITSSLIDLMEGEIKVSSTPNKGSEFSIFLPRVVPDESRQSTFEEAKVECPDLTGKTILVAEDNFVNMLIFKKMLKVSNANILEAVNGEEAIQICAKHNPDMIFMDIQMPVLDGINTCKVVRKSGYDSPIVAFTANVLTQEVDKYMSIGFDGVLAKPVEIETLYQLLQDYLG